MRAYSLGKGSEKAVGKFTARVGLLMTGTVAALMLGTTPIMGRWHFPPG
jgi:hypothetical protein